MPRPPKEDTIHFLRVLGSAERQILLAAGDGNISNGFIACLDFYRHFYELGYRPWMPVQFLDVALVTDQTNQRLVARFKRSKRHVCRLDDLDPSL